MKSFSMEHTSIFFTLGKKKKKKKLKYNTDLKIILGEK